MIHDCTKLATLIDDDARAKGFHGAYGPAIGGLISIENGYGEVSNDEYASAVHYCPYCGLDLRSLSKTGEGKPPVLAEVCESLDLTIERWKGLWRATTRPSDGGARFSLGETIEEAVLNAKAGEWGV